MVLTSRSRHPEQRHFLGLEKTLDHAHTRTPRARFTQQTYKIYPYLPHHQTLVRLGKRPKGPYEVGVPKVRGLCGSRWGLYARYIKSRACLLRYYERIFPKMVGLYTVTLGARPWLVSYPSSFRYGMVALIIPLLNRQTSICSSKTSATLLRHSGYLLTERLCGGIGCQSARAG